MSNDEATPAVDEEVVPTTPEVEVEAPAVDGEAPLPERTCADGETCESCQ